MVSLFSKILIASQTVLLIQGQGIGPAWVKLNKTDCQAATTTGLCPDYTDYMSSVAEDGVSSVDLGVSYNGQFVDFQIDSFASQFSDATFGNTVYEIDTYFLAKCTHFLTPKVSDEGCDSPGTDNCRAAHSISTSPSINSENLPTSSGDCEWNPFTSAVGEGFNLSFPFEVATIAKSSTGNMTILYYRWQLSWSIVTSQQLTLSAGATLEVGESQEILSKGAAVGFYQTGTDGDICTTTASSEVVFKTNQRICVGLIPEDATSYNVDVASVSIRDTEGSSVDLVTAYEVTWFGVEEQLTDGFGSFLSFYFPGSLVMDFEDGTPATLTLDFTVSFTETRRVLSGDEDTSLIEKVLSVPLDASTNGRNLLQTEEDQNMDLAMVAYFFSKSSGTCDAYGTVEIQGDDLSANVWEQEGYSDNLIEALARAVDVRMSQVTVSAITDVSLVGGVQVQFRILSLAETAAAEVVADLTVMTSNGEFARLVTASAIPSVTTVSLVDMSNACSSSSAYGSFGSSSNNNDDDDSSLFSSQGSTSTIAVIIGAVCFLSVMGLTMHRRQRHAQNQQLKQLGNKQQVVMLSAVPTEAVQGNCNPVFSESKKIKNIA